MGARRSTRWRAVPTRNRVENCLTISTKRPRPRAPMPVKALGVWGWNQGKSLLVFWFLNEDVKTGTGRVLELDFTRDKVPITQTIRLTSTTPHLGGSRWWLQCPGCGRRVMNLPLPGAFSLCLPSLPRPRLRIGTDKPGIHASALSSRDVGRGRLFDEGSAAHLETAVRRPDA